MTESHRRKRDVIVAKVALEEEWAYARRMERIGFPQMQELSALPVERGGLGYVVPARTLKRRADDYFANMRDVVQSDRASRAERQSHEIDERIRAARSDLIRAREMGDWRAIAEADRRMAAAMRDERELHGLNAPARIDATVTREHDSAAALVELNEMLAELGLPPVESLE